jgi:SPOR domain
MIVRALCLSLFLVSVRSAFSQQEPVLSFQVGAFIDKGNAERLSDKLLKRGFDGEIGRKTVGGREFWTVTVLAPPNPFEDFRQELLDAGFPSFPIR